jgi:hypothetical protein
VAGESQINKHCTSVTSPKHYVLWADISVNDPLAPDMGYCPRYVPSDQGNSLWWHGTVAKPLVERITLDELPDNNQDLIATNLSRPVLN